MFFFGKSLHARQILLTIGLASRLQNIERRVNDNATGGLIGLPYRVVSLFFGHIMVPTKAQMISPCNFCLYKRSFNFKLKKKALHDYHNIHEVV